eukprot:3050850-Pleurochrysis_carterae.AAC.2
MGRSRSNQRTAQSAMPSCPIASTDYSGLATTDGFILLRPECDDHGHGSSLYGQCHVSMVSYELHDMKARVSMNYVSDLKTANHLPGTMSMDEDSSVVLTNYLAHSTAIQLTR